MLNAVVGERHQRVPQRLDRPGAVALLLHTGLEAGELGVEDLLLLLAHRLAQQVGPAQREAGHLLGDLDHVLLVDDEVVRRPEDLLERLGQLGVDGRGRLAAGLAHRVVGVAVDAHRARAVERDGRRDVLERRRLHLAQQGAGAAAVELEHPERVAALQDLVGLGVGHVLGQDLEVDLLAPVGADVLDGVVEDGQVAQAQEVHLDQAQRLAAGVVELGDDLAVLLTAHDRDEVDERLAAHDDAGRVHAPLALQPLQAQGGLDDLLGRLVLLVQRAEVGALVVARMGWGRRRPTGPCPCP